NCQSVLALIEYCDAIVVPTPPIRHDSFVACVRRLNFVSANPQNVSGRRHSDNGIIHGLTQRVVAKDPRESPVLYSRSQMNRPGEVRRNCELVTRQVRTPGLNLIVLRKSASAPK